MPPRTQLFAEYQCPWVRQVFGVPFARLLDSLAVFLTSSGAELAISFPGLNDELICEYKLFGASGCRLLSQKIRKQLGRMAEEGEETLFCTYAQLDTHVMSYPPDLADYWEDPSSYFILPGSTLFLILGRIIKMPNAWQYRRDAEGGG